ncbi:hypothetical protein [Pseudobacteriovorax antillogorgiicola]|uniref:Uncharacterized protein n=1 Tax=Pseudobacteriovorax antillogorgiicola TaxID=1513793 RepID=A0A1Y6C0R0_9BACT|nr:hypothetical protein [Pseudobacteriovorax antillogorgiicola]TCS51139.1 hypothetical protein EDD56_11120 [Pseudobacteriovorax antillogorgiicola]SMF38389.1 hypothetical protein SAMN06296036_111157 [Pseudobacteriovorax antillogorgiicola]
MKKVTDTVFLLGLLSSCQSDFSNSYNSDEILCGKLNQRAIYVESEAGDRLGKGDFDITLDDLSISKGATLAVNPKGCIQLESNTVVQLFINDRGRSQGITIEANPALKSPDLQKTTLSPFGDGGYDFWQTCGFLTKQPNTQYIKVNYSKESPIDYGKLTVRIDDKTYKDISPKGCIGYTTEDREIEIISDDGLVARFETKDLENYDLAKVPLCAPTATPLVNSLKCETTSEEITPSYERFRVLLGSCARISAETRKSASCTEYFSAPSKFTDPSTALCGSRDSEIVVEWRTGPCEKKIESLDISEGCGVIEEISRIDYSYFEQLQRPRICSLTNSNHTAFTSKSSTREKECWANERVWENDSCTEALDAKVARIGSCYEVFGDSQVLSCTEYEITDTSLARHLMGLEFTCTRNNRGLWSNEACLDIFPLDQNAFLDKGCRASRSRAQVKTIRWQYARRFQPINDIADEDLPVCNY